MTSEQADQIRTAIDTGGLSVGDALRARREQLGWSLSDVAAWLRIKLAYLEALELGQVAKLPGNAYAFGFLRAYSGVLGLDAEDMSRRFRREAKDINRRPDLAFPAPVPERGVPAGAVVLLGVLVVVGAYAGWYELSGHERGVPHPVPPVPAALLPYAGGPAVTPSPQVVTVMPGPGQTPSPLPSVAAGAKPAATTSPAPTPASGALPTDATTAAATPTAATPATALPVAPAGPTAPAPSVPGPAAPLPAAAVPSVPSAAPVPAMPAAGPPAATPDTPAVAGQITLRALASCWVQVRQVGGRVIYDHVLQPGDSWAVPADAGAVTLTTGNAGGLTVAADGVTSPPLGRNGTVRRAVPLTLAAIRDGTIAAEAQPQATPGSIAATTATPVVASAPPPRRAAAARPAPPADDSTDRLNAQQLRRTTPH